MNVLILGSTSWVATYFINEINNNYKDIKLLGISRRKADIPTIENVVLGNYTIYELLPQVDKIKPDCIINMLVSGNQEYDFKIHQKIFEHCLKKNIQYIFCSTSNAFDGKPDEVHYEDDAPFGASVYGQFKVQCEDEMRGYLNKSTILRFAATHGYAPNRISRTEEFLQNLKKNKVTKVHTGVWQNRTYTGHLAKMIAKIVSKKAVGIFHLGPLDQSEEIEFYKKVAIRFGYCSDLVEEGDNENLIMTVIPQRLIDEFGDDFLYTEDQAVESLANDPNLLKYHK
jgi:dTDP-4-dehydrorhamnose reductase